MPVELRTEGVADEHHHRGAEDRAPQRSGPPRTTGEQHQRAGEAGVTGLTMRSRAANRPPARPAKPPAITNAANL